MLILYYHRVGDFLKGETRKLSVEPATFRFHIELLQKFRARFVSPDDLAKYIVDGKPLPRRAALITFDDAYADVAVHAIPELAKHGIPSLMFVATGLLGKKDPDKGLHMIMTREAVHSLARYGCEAGAHSITHRSLRGMPPREVGKEIYESKCELEEMTGKKARFFAYPKGEYDAFAARIVQEAGFVAAFGTKKAPPMSPGKRFEIQRIPVSANDGPVRFGFKLAKRLELA